MNEPRRRYGAEMVELEHDWPLLRLMILAAAVGAAIGFWAGL